MLSSNLPSNGIHTCTVDRLLLLHGGIHQHHFSIECGPEGFHRARFCRPGLLRFSCLQHADFQAARKSSARAHPQLLQSLLEPRDFGHAWQWRQSEIIMLQNSSIAKVFDTCEHRGDALSSSSTQKRTEHAWWTKTRDRQVPLLENACCLKDCCSTRASSRCRGVGPCQHDRSLVARSLVGSTYLRSTVRQHEFRIIEARQHAKILHRAGPKAYEALQSSGPASKSGQRSEPQDPADKEASSRLR